jgi:hypothetical protein
MHRWLIPSLTMKVCTSMDGRQVRTTLNDVIYAPDFIQYAPHGISKLFSQGLALYAGIALLMRINVL